METPPILHLPGEIRNTIYNLILPPPVELEFNVYRGAAGRRYGPEYDTAFALARACKTIAAETLCLFYGQNSFKINIKPFYLDGFGRANISAPRKVWVDELHRFLCNTAIGTKPIKKLTLVIYGEISGYALLHAHHSFAPMFGQRLAEVRKLLVDDVQLTVGFAIAHPDRDIGDYAYPPITLPANDRGGVRSVLDQHRQQLDNESWEGVQRFFKLLWFS